MSDQLVRMKRFGNNIKLVPMISRLVEKIGCDGLPGQEDNLT